MKARDRRYGNGRRLAMRTRVGIAAAAAALAGGGALAAIAATSGSGATAARSADYGHSYMTPAAREWSSLNTAMNHWGWSSQSSYSQLAGLNQVRTFSQTWQHQQMLATQRGIVVLATKQFLILKSANGSLHLWLLSGTRFQNVSSTSSGMSALTASTWATNQAMTDNDMAPATSLLAGSTGTATQMMTPATSAQTVTVNVANTNLKVTVTVTSTMATVTQTATMPAWGWPRWSPVTYRQYAWQKTNGIARGDLALVVGTRSDWTLHARLVLYAPPSTTSSTAPVTTPEIPASNTGTTGSGFGSGTSSGGFSGTHT